MPSDPIRLFVGCAPNGEDSESCAVLEYTAKKHCTGDLDIEWMHQSKDGFWSGWNTKYWRTPFSGYRYGIPAFCNYEGRGIYCDSDFIVMADLTELWNQEIPGAMLARSAGRKGKTCCLLFDNAKMAALLPPIHLLKAIPDQNGWAKENIPAEHTTAFSGDWNCIDGGSYADVNDPRIKAHHLSRMEHQPHLTLAAERLAADGRRHWYTGPTTEHPRRDLTELFMRELRGAINAGYTLNRYNFEDISIQKRDFQYKHHVSPS